MTRCFAAAVVSAALFLTTGPSYADVIPFRAVCGGVAPEETHCSTGTWDVAGVSEQGIFLHPGYAGTIESRETWTDVLGGSGVSHFRCDVDPQGHFECGSSGEKPTPIASFVHECFSFAFGTSTPGGSGSWYCYTAHPLPIGPP